ncbi:PREDICTED: uncharacterized protein LOC106807054 [Priapulus caudatus]|uniref:Uncharacterized protein LOC106807054 n=1 Tax=Priapulus caudatus TaxID=37621 RepID=A0ABM1DXU6_PRICU|nr:PREDICTED: uncharacterized protein LOC106807054 [Priapulus caudatus]
MLAAASDLVDESTISHYFNSRARLSRLNAGRESATAQLILAAFVLLQREAASNPRCPTIKSLLASHVLAKRDGGEMAATTLRRHLLSSRFYVDVSGGAQPKLDSAEVEALVSLHMRQVVEETCAADGRVTVITSLKPEAANSLGGEERIGYRNGDQLEVKLAMQSYYKCHSYFESFCSCLTGERLHVPAKLLVHLIDYLVVFWKRVNLDDFAAAFTSFNGELMLKKNESCLLRLNELLLYALAALKADQQACVAHGLLPMLSSLVGVSKSDAEATTSTLADYLADWCPRAAAAGWCDNDENSCDLNALLEAHDAWRRLLKVAPASPSTSFADLVEKRCLSDADAVVKGSSSGTPYSDQLVQDLKESDLQFTFGVDELTNGEAPELICSFCQKSGHLNNDCPDEIIPELLPLPPMKTGYLKMLDSICYAILDQYAPDTAELQERSRVLFETQTFVRKGFPDAELCLFGSSVNGFGFRGSDLDICMTFQNSSGEGLNQADIIENLAKHLKSCKGLYNVCAISTAKVPIVKFKHRRSQWEGDISLYNLLAQNNTSLLSTYAEIDDRVRILGYVMKVFAKHFGLIKDPYTRGNLGWALSAPKLWDYIYDRLRGAYKYFGVPQTVEGPLFTCIKNSESILLLDLRAELQAQQVEVTKGKKLAETDSIKSPKTESRTKSEEGAAVRDGRKLADAAPAARNDAAPRTDATTSRSLPVAVATPQLLDDPAIVASGRLAQLPTPQSERAAAPGEEPAQSSDVFEKLFVMMRESATEAFSETTAAGEVSRRPDASGIDPDHKVWPHLNKNKQTCGELWLGMLRFYTERFNFNEQVVSIRQLQPLMHFEKMWNFKTLAIEDPFNLSHNLGQGLQRKMNTYILKALIRARMHFSTPVNMYCMTVYKLCDYLLDANQLTDAEPPNDRGCRLCGKIGHLVKDCPNTIRARRKDAVERQQLIREREQKERQEAGYGRESTREKDMSEHLQRPYSQPVAIPGSWNKQVQQGNVPHISPAYHPPSPNSRSQASVVNSPTSRGHGNDSRHYGNSPATRSHGNESRQYATSPSSHAPGTDSRQYGSSPATRSHGNESRQYATSPSSHAPGTDSKASGMLSTRPVMVTKAGSMPLLRRATRLAPTAGSRRDARPHAAQRRQHEDYTDVHAGHLEPASVQAGQP